MQTPSREHSERGVWCSETEKRSAPPHPHPSSQTDILNFMATNQDLIEDIKALNKHESYNIYITKDRVYLIAIDKCSAQLKKLNKTYNSITVIGRPFGLLGALITIIPAEIFVGPKLRNERKRVLADLRNIEIHELDNLPGYKVYKHEVEFEEQKKDRYKVHLAGEQIFMLAGEDARKLQMAIH
jgi:hypothetical protein